MFGGQDISSAQSQSSGALNSSGWTVGGGKSKGGSLDAESGAGLPWYAWVSLGIVALAYWRKKKRGK